MSKNDRDTDYEAFLTADHAAPEISAHQVERIKKNILKDLVKSPQQMVSFYLLISLLGYLVSLSICAQNGFGLFHFSHTILASLHGLPGLLCPIVCGMIFTGVPFVVSLFFLNRFQHRYLLFKLWWVVAIVPITATAVMAFLPHYLQHNLADMMSHELLLTRGTWLGVWAISAVATPYILEFLAYLALGRRRS